MQGRTGGVRRRVGAVGVLSPRRRGSSSALGFFAVVVAAVASSADAKTVRERWVIRPQIITSANATFSPDCYLGDRRVLLVNDINPGPVLRAEVGDVVKVTIVNKSPTDAVTVHYHGLSMKGYPYSDGTGAVSQCSVGPLQTQVNEFVAEDVGTHYWHGHTGMERVDGLQGAIVITDPHDEDEKLLRTLYDEERILFLQDWYHREGSFQRTGLDSLPFRWIGNPQTLLINGKGQYLPCLESEDNCVENCGSAGGGYLPEINVEQGKTYRLRIISGAQLVGLNLAISDHAMMVVEADGTLVRPFSVNNLDIMPAQRFSVILRADQSVDYLYVMETSVRFRDSSLRGRAVVRYDSDVTSPAGIDTNLFPEWDAPPSLDSTLFTRDITKYYDHDILRTSRRDVRKLVIVGTQGKRLKNGALRWAANNISTTWQAEPLLLTSYLAAHDHHAEEWPDTEIPGTAVVPDRPRHPFNYAEPIQPQVGEFVHRADAPGIIKLTYGEVVDVVLQNALALNGVAEMHSWHLHGHFFYVVGQGNGTFVESEDWKKYNLVDPLRRDTVAVYPNGWTAIRFYADNPGVWPLHCTQTAHGVMGMGLNFVVSPDKLDRPPPGAMSCLKTSLDPHDSETCRKGGGTSSGGGSHHDTGGSDWGKGKGKGGSRNSGGSHHDTGGSDWGKGKGTGWESPRKNSKSKGQTKSKGRSKGNGGKKAYNKGYHYGKGWRGLAEGTESSRDNTNNAN